MFAAAGFADRATPSYSSYLPQLRRRVALVPHNRGQRDSKSIRWGRLCGEQKDLRAWLAEAVGMPLRTIVPLDWDHVWSESRDETSWQPPSDDSARNFAARLDEGIGSWTCVLAIHHESAHCEDVTDQY